MDVTTRPCGRGDNHSKEQEKKKKRKGGPEKYFERRKGRRVGCESSLLCPGRKKEVKGSYSLTTLYCLEAKVPPMKERSR